MRGRGTGKVTSKEKQTAVKQTHKEHSTGPEDNLRPRMDSFLQVEVTGFLSVSSISVSSISIHIHCSYM